MEQARTKRNRANLVGGSMGRRPSTSSGRTNAGETSALHMCTYLTDTGSNQALVLTQSVGPCQNFRVVVLSCPTRSQYTCPCSSGG